MDPVTHAVIGMAVSKLSGNGIVMSNPMTIGIIAGAVFPDIDIVMQKWGDYAYLKNHRGVTHSIPGIAVSALIISAILKVIFPTVNMLELYLWSALGGLSHAFIDLFNSYGAKLLWPVIKKRFSLSLLLTFDPFLLGLLGGYILSGNVLQNIFIGLVPVYLAVRAIMRLGSTRGLVKIFGSDFKSISLLPSLSGFFRWHFILETDRYNIVGEKNMLCRGVRIIKKLDKLPDEALDKVVVSQVGEFFSEFTPLSHIACEKNGSIKRYIFIDMRYYIRDNFLHHAVLEMDKNNRIVKQSFNPYSMKRSCPIAMY